MSSAKANKSTFKDFDWVRCREEGRLGKHEIGGQYRKIRKRREIQNNKRRIRRSPMFLFNIYCMG